MPKRNFLFISTGAFSSDLAWSVVKGGHRVKMFIKDPDFKDTADGLVEKSLDWEKDLPSADVVVFDDTNGMGPLAEKIRSAGKLVVGGTVYTDRLEDDREFGQNELKKAGIKIVEQEDFSIIADAITYIRKNPGCYVAKPGGRAANVKRLLFIGETPDGSDVISTLEGYEKGWKNSVAEVQLQRRVYGVEIGIGAFFNGQRFISPVNYNFEHKRLCTGDLGPLTGEMGTGMFWGPPTKLYHETIAKFEKQLAAVHFVGYFDLECIANEEGIWPLDFTARFGFPTINIQSEGMPRDMGEFLYGLAAGKDVDFPVKPGYQVGVRLRVPPYPYHDEGMLAVFGSGVEIRFLENDLTGVHIEDAKLIDGVWYVAGNEASPLVITGCGLTVEQAQHEAYARVSKIRMPNMFYRLDIGSRCPGDIQKLLAWGYL